MKFLKVVLVLQVMVLILISICQKGNEFSSRSMGDFETGTAGWNVLDSSISSVTRETSAAFVHEGISSGRA